MNLFRIGSVSFVSMLAFGVPRVAGAQEQGSLAERTKPIEKMGAANVFGQPGQIAISSDAGLFISNTNVSGQSGSTTSIQLRPSIDYFVAENVSVGGFLGLDYTNAAGDAGHTLTFSIGPRVGYNISLNKMFSIWPKVGLSFSSTSISENVPTTTLVNGVPVTTTSSQTTTSGHLALNLFVPFMIHPVEHFFLGFGPAFDVDLTGDNKATTIAGRLTIGGWI